MSGVALFTTNARTINLEFAASINDATLAQCLPKFTKLTSVNANADLGYVLSVVCVFFDVFITIFLFDAALRQYNGYRCTYNRIRMLETDLTFIVYKRQYYQQSKHLSRRARCACEF
jgi:hypothetical protein